MLFNEENAKKGKKILRKRRMIRIIKGSKLEGIFHVFILVRLNKE